MPEASQDGDKANQRQPFQNLGRIELPVRVDRHQSDRGEEMRRVPPYCHCGIHEATGERPDNNFFFADAAVLEPHRDQAQNDGEQEKWQGSNGVAAEVLGGLGPARFFVPPPGAEKQDNGEKDDLCF